jgi:hypothetical protein
MAICESFTLYGGNRTCKLGSRQVAKPRKEAKRNLLGSVRGMTHLFRNGIDNLPD